jgi:pimeloyl-ACP methyl ester carboxylesterase
MPRGQALDSWYMALFNLPWLPERLLADPRTAGRFLRGAGLTREMVETYRRDIVDGGALPGALGWYRALPLSNARLLRVPVQVPTTYIWSDRDAALGRAGADLCERYVDAPYTFEVVEGASHWLLDERPEEVAGAILRRVDPESAA